MMDTRRDFIKGTAWMGAVAAAAGCVSGNAAAPAPAGEKAKPNIGATRPRSAGCSAMSNFAVAPIPRIHIAFIGIGSRGSAAVRRVSRIPGCEVTVLCDLREQAVKENIDWLKKNVPAQQPKRTYFGKDDSYKAACDDDGVDLVYIAAPAYLHHPIATYAMRAGCHVLTEVPAAHNIDQLWDFVETCEKTKRHCMMLENTCYGEMEMLAWNLCHQGILGTLTHAEGAYIHNLVERQLENSFRNRGKKNMKVFNGRGNGYPTHPLGPIASYLDLNRGDKMDTIVSMSNRISTWNDYIADTFGPDDWQSKVKIDQGAINTSIIRTAKGRTIMLQHDTATPRPYSRINMVQGSKGIFADYPPRLSLTKRPGRTNDIKKKGHSDWYDEKTFEEMREKYKHPLWKSVGEIAKKVGGHGGMDFVMDLRWAYCLQNGLPLDMDVYDLASWSSISPCSRESDMKGSIPVDIPDFTRGAWKTAKPQIIGDVDMKKMGIQDGKFKKSNDQIEV